MVSYGLTLAIALMLSAGIFLLQHLNAERAVVGNPFFFELVFGFGLVGCLLAMRSIYKGSRPICISAEGIFALGLGTKWDCIPWKSITQIVQVRFFDPLYSRDSSTYLIFWGASKKMRFSDDISDISILIMEVSSYAKKHGITILLRDTRRKPSTPGERFNVSPQPKVRQIENLEL
ncbi:MAG: hypothetical protein WDM91_22295 [Rhizomicrobium sp.]